MSYSSEMAADPKHLERLIEELSQLPERERARLVAEATRRSKTLPKTGAFRRPLLNGGEAWVGGDIRREELYDDDGR